MGAPAISRRDERKIEDVLGGNGSDYSPVARVIQAPDYILGPMHISVPLRAFLRDHETMLRAMAAEEAERDEFTPGLSRCVGLLDSEVEA